MGKIKFEKDNILPKKMIIAVWDSKSNSAVYTIWLGPGAIIGVGDRKSSSLLSSRMWPGILRDWYPLISFVIGNNVL